jgi:chorismate mutase/prephenate dehydratase
MSEEEKLQQIRSRIDQLDADIQELIRQRAECAREVARVKREAGENDGFYRPEREAEVLRNVQARNSGPLGDEDMAHLFREIMAACRGLQQSLRVAYFGPRGTFTQAAALKHFGHNVPLVEHGAIDEVFRDVESGNSAYGVVPVENSTEGVVNHTLDSFINSSLRICGEVELRIHHHLLGRMNDLSEVTCIYSHQQSLAQCREWLGTHLGGIPRVAVSSNAEAARLAGTGSGAAAIAGEIAAEIYELNILARSIEDEPDNTTRFLVVGRHAVAPSGNDKTSLLVSAANKPGALHRLLAPFSAHNISMTRIESRPSRRGMWDYVFFIDIDGHERDADVAAAIRDLEKEAAMLRILGSYPRALV